MKLTAGFFLIASIGFAQTELSNKTFRGNVTIGTTVSAKGIGDVYYAAQYASGSTTCGVTEAATAASAANANLGGTVMLPFGSCTATTAIALREGIKYIGYGGMGNANTLNGCGTLLRNASSDVFSYTGTHENSIDVSNLCIWSVSPGGGHVFNLNGAGAANVLANIHDFTALQNNPAKSFILSTTAANPFIKTRVRNGYISYGSGATTPIINVASNALNSVIVEDVWFASGAATTSPAISLTQMGTTFCGGQIVMRNVTFEPQPSVAYAGALSFSKVCNLLIDSISVDAVGYTPTAPVISITPTSTIGSVTAPITILNSSSFGGTSAYPDLFVAQTTPSQVTLIGNNFLWAAGAAGQPYNYVGINNNIVNEHDTIPVKLGPEMLTNGSFAADAVWAKGAGVTIAGGVASLAAVSGNAIYQTPPVVAGVLYRLSYDVVTFTAGTITPFLYGAPHSYGANRGSVGTFIDYLWGPPTSNGYLYFAGTGFTGTIDNVSLKPVSGSLPF